MKNKFTKQFEFWFYWIALVTLNVCWPLIIIFHTDNTLTITEKVVSSILICLIYTFMLTVFIVKYYLIFKSDIRWIIKTEKGYFIGIEDGNCRISDNRYAAKLLDKDQLKLCLEMFEKDYSDCKIEAEEVLFKEIKKWEK